MGGMTDMSNTYVNYGELKEMVADDAKRVAKLAELKDLLDKEGGAVSRKTIVLQHACNRLESTETVKKAVTERRFQLQQQFLQLVRQHVANTGGPDQLGSYLPKVHLSLLNQYTKGDHRTGWHKDEGNLMQDMAPYLRK